MTRKIQVLLHRVVQAGASKERKHREREKDMCDEDNIAYSVLVRVNICCCCDQGSLSVALPPPQSTPTYYSLLHQLMMSQSIHKFVVVCRFKKFDMAAGCTGMKELSGQAAKM